MGIITLSKTVVTKIFCKLHFVNKLVIITGNRTLILRRKYWDKMEKLHGKKWILDRRINIPNIETMHLVTTKYMYHYKIDDLHTFGFCKGKEYYHKIEKAIKSNVHNNVVCDCLNGNGLFYDIEEKPILKRIGLDYIRCPVRDNKYRFEALIKHLKSHPKVKDFIVVDIPHHSVDEGIYNQKGLQFHYCPTQIEFNKLINLGGSLNENYKWYGHEYPHSYETFQAIFKSLGIEKFKLKDI